MHLVANLKFHSRTERVDITFHFLGERVVLRSIVDIPTQHHTAGILTKALAQDQFANSTLT